MTDGEVTLTVNIRRGSNGREYFAYVNGDLLGVYGDLTTTRERVTDEVGGYIDALADDETEEGLTD